MELISIIMAGVTAVILFVFGLEHFSKEIEKITGERFRRSLSRATRLPVIGVILGALVTAVIQSSSATSVITIGLVNAGVLSFKNSVGIIFGSNVGTTVTAQLLAFKLTAFAPAFIIVGFLLSLVRSRYSIFGKSIFYFGFVFFSLNLISSTLSPLQNEPAFTDLLTQAHNPLLAILVGCLITAVVQSSSVTTGLAIIFTQQGLMSLENAVPLIMGANIGTTATALIAMFNMDTAAKKTALSHFLFNVGGVIIFTPLLFIYGHRLNSLAMAPAIALANIHLAFNVATTLLFLTFINPFTRLVDNLLGKGKMDFQRIPIPVYLEGTEFKEVKTGLRQGLIQMTAFLQENYSQVTLSIETNYRGVYEAAAKRIEYLTYVKKEFLGYFSKIVPAVASEEDSRELMHLTTEFDYLFQIHDSIDDLFTAKKVMNENYIELRSDVLLLVRELSIHSLSLFDDIRGVLDGDLTVDISHHSKELQDVLDRTNRSLLALCGFAAVAGQAAQFCGA
jgi:phosphate:Na+ symporter